MKIFITGGRGFLGNYITARLQGHHDLVVTDHEDADVRNLPALTQQLEKSRPDVVMHLAALCGAVPSVQNPHTYFDVNLMGTVNVLEACRQVGIKRLLFTSSMTVFGKCDASTAVTEDSPFAPRHPYASSKAAAEITIKSYVDHYGLAAVIMRPTLVVGENCKEKHAIADFVMTTLAGKPIEIYGSGSHVRDFIHPLDVAEAVAAGIERLRVLPEGGYETFNCSSGEYFSMAKLAELVVKELGEDPKQRIKFIGATNQTFSLFTSNAKAEKVLGWAPKIKITDIVTRLKQPEGGLYGHENNRHDHHYQRT